MKILRVLFMGFGVLFTVLFFLYGHNTFAGKTYGKWLCENTGTNKILCIGIGRGALKDVEQFKKTKAACHWVCERVCERDEETGKQTCVEVCRGDGPACDRELQHGKIPHAPFVMP
ncbi:MAG: hypothetical protein CVU51_06170 [Deltaproteobacteria bacterium HGW-Deltaproteobacteria-1]|jgi:hypothetical protein|nr:MAG: hypothetical protein CVU51_06170 [Deltaproteobacteria bacterium HGW-Deltaproteobacteria-1]